MIRNPFATDIPDCLNLLMMLKPSKPGAYFMLFVTEETVKLQKEKVVGVERVSAFNFAYGFQSA
jgi:hypothetical protein